MGCGTLEVVTQDEDGTSGFSRGNPCAVGGAPPNPDDRVWVVSVGGAGHARSVVSRCSKSKVDLL
jgi:hypothetical protein